ncbi:MAG: hypothetical protein MJ119_06145 [Lachnospiraceae bacterium]|nr:hypothetical protein [Lachnospiraceae bacterium]
MKTIKIADVTIKEAVEKAGYTLSFKEKMDVARQLEKLNTDVIEMPAPASQTENILIKSLAPVLSNCEISVAAGLSVKEIDAAWAAVSLAKNPRLHILVPTSPVLMEFMCGMKPKKIMEKIPEVVSYAKSLCKEVEFSCLDATRSEADFLAKVIDSAIASGATVIDICDTAGMMMPEEIVSFIGEIKSKVPALGDVTLSITCSDAFNLATSNTFAAAAAGAGEIKTSLVGDTAPDLDRIVNLFTERGESFDISTNLSRPDVQKAIRHMTYLDGNTGNAYSKYEEAGKEEVKTEIDLDENSDISKVIKVIKKLGYDLSDDDNAKVYKEFKRVSEKKKVGKKEMEAIIATAALQVPPTYSLENFVINSGNIITPTAQVTLEKDGNLLKGLSSGDGPIAAAFLAVEMVVGCHYELDDFQIQSITEGSEAVGNALVKLRSNGKLYSGNGISTDIIGASIRAYLNAINKIVYDEAQKQ